MTDVICFVFIEIIHIVLLSRSKIHDLEIFRKECIFLSVDIVEYGILFLQF